MVRHKFNARKTEALGRKYDSKLEATYAEFLAWRQKMGQVVGWFEQIPLRLAGGITYRLDFLVFEADGTVHAIEVKGFETKEWKMKMKLVREAYPWLDVEVVKKAPT